MILWLVRDRDGDLVTKFFLGSKAVAYIQKMEIAGVKGLRLEKIFQAEQRELELPLGTAGLRKKIKHADKPAATSTASTVGSP